MIFAREVSDSLTSLVKQIDAETAKNSKAKMGSFVVFLSDDEKLEGKLKSLSDKEGLKKCILSIDNVAGPKGYKLTKGIRPTNTGRRVGAQERWASTRRDWS